jgi:hypothetical protein
MSGKTAKLVSILFTVEEFDFCNATSVLLQIERASIVRWDFMYDLSNLHGNIP